MEQKDHKKPRLPECQVIIPGTIDSSKKAAIEFIQNAKGGGRVNAFYKKGTLDIIGYKAIPKNRETVDGLAITQIPIYVNSSV